MEREPQIQGLSEPVATLLSSKSDVIPISTDSAQILFFADESLPPCLAIQEHNAEWASTKLLFIDNRDVLKALNELGVEALLNSQPHEFHIDGFTDPKNDSDRIEWQLYVDDAPDSEFGDAEDSTEESSIKPPPPDDTPFAVLSFGEEKIPVSFANSHIIEVGSDEGMDHLVVEWQNPETGHKRVCYFIEDIDDENLLEAIHDEQMKFMYYPQPTESIVNNYYKQNTGENFDLEAEVDFLAFDLGEDGNGKKKKNNGDRRPASRGAAIRAQKRATEDAHRIASQYLTADNKPDAKDRPRANFIDDSPRLKVVGLGGFDGGGSKNTILVEYKNDAVIMDCGSDLGVDLPGINYGIADMSYLESIRHKLKAYIITHGHLDHIGGLPHVLPKFPAPVYGSRFTIGRVEEIFQNFGLPMPEGFELQTVIMNEDNHERLKIGEFFVELIRVTHSIPGSTCIVLDTPVGRIFNTGDFRLDPNPLDHERTDIERLKELGRDGILLLMSESTTSDRPGRTPSESTIEESFVQIMDQAPGRIFVAIFSTNVNRIQMIVNAAIKHGRKIALDGRSMISTLEMAVRNGFMKIPKGTFVPIASVPSLKDQDVIVVCTGGQGEPNSALQRMATGEHRHVKLKSQDTVILSSTPIPYTGNDALVRGMVDNLFKDGVHVFRHESREVDQCGPLHVSGHASMDEYGEMIDMLQPKFFLPVMGDYTGKKYHIELAVEHGIPRKNTLNPDNGDVIAISDNSMEIVGKVPHGTVLVDQTGAEVSHIVVKDRLMLSNEGLVAVVLTVDKKSGQLMTSPDIISRGFIYMKDQEELMNDFRIELKRAVGQRFKRVDLDRFKLELKDHVTHFLYEKTGRSPIVIPVVNVIGAKTFNGPQNGNRKGKKPTSPEKQAEDMQKRFADMRSRLLNQDARID